MALKTSATETVCEDNSEPSVSIQLSASLDRARPVNRSWKMSGCGQGIDAPTAWGPVRLRPVPEGRLRARPVSG